MLPFTTSLRLTEWPLIWTFIILSGRPLEASLSPGYDARPICLATNDGGIFRSSIRQGDADGMLLYAVESRQVTYLEVV